MKLNLKEIFDNPLSKYPISKKNLLNVVAIFLAIYVRVRTVIPRFFVTFRSNNIKRND